MQKTKRALLYLSLVITLAFYAFYVLFFGPKYVRTEYSPDKLYRLDIYREQRLFAMPGDGGSDCAVFKLYRRNKRIKDDLEDCETFINTMEIRWDFDYCMVWIARGHGIHLDSEDCK